MIDIVILISWSILGLLVLIDKRKPNKSEYVLVWAMLILELIENIIE